MLPAPVAQPPAAPLSTPNIIQAPPDAAEAAAWFRSEVDFMTGEIETLRNRAWDLETALRASKEQAAVKKQGVTA